MLLTVIDDVSLVRFDPAADLEQLRALYDLFAAATAIDDPDGPSLAPDLAFRLPVRGQMQGGRTYPGIWAQCGDDHPQECWLATDRSGRVVGGYLLELPEQDYDNVVFAFPVVAPPDRRRGIGTVLLRHAAGRAAGRETMLGVAVNPSAGVAFGAAMGGQRSPYDDVRRVLTLDGGYWDRVGGFECSEYATVAWDGSIPEEYLDGVAGVLAAMADAPRPGSMAQEEWTPQRIRESGAREAARGLQSYGVAAVSARTGEFVAMTELAVDPALPGWAFQGMTAVSRRHRGRRLGMRVKVALLDRLRSIRPDLHAVMTCNAASNHPHGCDQRGTWLPQDADPDHIRAASGLTRLTDAPAPAARSGPQSRRWPGTRGCDPPGDPGLLPDSHGPAARHRLLPAGRPRLPAR